MQHASSALHKILRDRLRSEGPDAALLAWPLACGAKVAERTIAVQFAAGVLTVSVPDAAWLSQLESFRSRYLAKLNQIISEKVTNIEFIVAKTEPH